MGDQRTHERRRQPQDADAVVLDETPETVRSRVVGGAIVEEAGSAEQAGPVHEPGPHHPTHVRHPVDDLTGVDVGAEGHVLGSLHRETAVRVHGALGCSRGPGRVDDHQQVFGGGGLTGRRGRLRRDDIVPPVVTPSPHAHLKAADPPVDDDTAHRRNGGQGVVGRRLHRHHRSAAVLGVRGEQTLGARVVESSRDRPRAEPGEQGQSHGADPGQRQQGDGDRHTHRHEEADDIALAEAETAQGVGAAIHLLRELLVRQGVDGAFFRFGDDGRARRAGRLREPSVDAVGGDVEAAADAPYGKLYARRQVDDLRIGAVEPDVEECEHGLREPGDVR